jgi:hypothetical protein
MKINNRFFLVLILALFFYLLGGLTVRYRLFPYKIFITQQNIEPKNTDGIANRNYKDRRFEEVGKSIAKLKEGGLLVYMRHAHKTPILEESHYSSRQAYDVFVSKLVPPIEKNDYNGSLCLTNEGKLQCFIIHNAINNLGIKFNEIYSSPTIRTKETARFVFPDREVIVDPSLIYPEIQIQNQNTHFKTSKRNLFERLASDIIGTKENTFIVAHSSPTLRQVFDMPIDLDQGDCAIIEFKDDTFSLIDVIKPLDWALQLK